MDLHWRNASPWCFLESQLRFFFTSIINCKHWNQTQEEIQDFNEFSNENNGVLSNPCSLNTYINWFMNLALLHSLHSFIILVIIKSCFTRLSLCSLPLFITLPLKWLAFKAPVIDRQDGFPEPIRQEIPWLVSNEPGKFKGDILYHQVWVWLAVMSCFVLLLTSQVGMSTLMYDG